MLALVGRRRRTDDRLLLRPDRHRVRLYYRRYLFKSVKNFIFVGLLPLFGGLTLAFIFVWGIKDYADPTTRSRRAGSASARAVARSRHACWRHPAHVLVELEGPCVLPGADRPDRLPSAARGRRAAPAARSRGRTALMAGEIVLGYDGEPGSRVALQTAVAIAGAFKRPLVIAFGYAPAADRGRRRRPVESRARDRREDHRRGREDRPRRGRVGRSARRARERPAGRGDPARRRPVRRLGDRRRRGRGRGPIAGALLGSVTYQVVHRSNAAGRGSPFTRGRLISPDEESAWLTSHPRRTTARSPGSR